MNNKSYDDTKQLFDELNMREEFFYTFSPYLQSYVQSMLQDRSILKVERVLKSYGAFSDYYVNHMSIFIKKKDTASIIFFPRRVNYDVQLVSLTWDLHLTEEGKVELRLFVNDALKKRASVRGNVIIKKEMDITELYEERKKLFFFKKLQPTMDKLKMKFIRESELNLRSAINSIINSQLKTR
jgi:hypothetical protein